MVNPLYVGAVPSYKQLDFPSREENIINLEKKYKLFSILNTKYIVSSKDNQDSQTQYTKVVKTIENKEGNGYINELLNFRSRIVFITAGFLIIGEDNTDIFNAIKTRSIIFLPEYAIETTTFFSGNSSYLEDYTIEELGSFSGIILYKNKIKNEELFQEILERYKLKGGKIIQGDIFEENLYSKRRSPNSLFTDKPAFSPKESLREELKEILKSENSKSNTFEIIEKEEKPGNITIRFKAKEKGFLVYSETFYPGWEAKLDGKSTKLFMAESLVKGVVINEPGEHSLVLSYKPKSFIVGSILSGGTILFVIALLIRKLHRMTYKNGRIKLKNYG